MFRHQFPSFRPSSSSAILYTGVDRAIAHAVVNAERRVPVELDHITAEKAKFVGVLLWQKRGILHLRTDAFRLGSHGRIGAGRQGRNDVWYSVFLYFPEINENEVSSVRPDLQTTAEASNALICELGSFNPKNTRLTSTQSQAARTWCSV